MKIKNIVLTALSSVLLLTGCADNKNISTSELLNKKESLNQIFSKMLYQNDNYPYIYQIYLTKRGQYVDDSKILNNLNILCKSRGGKVMYINDFLSKYQLDESSIGDRCFINPKIAINQVCFVPNKPVPKVLFVVDEGEKVNTQLHFNYLRTVNVGGIKSAYIGYTPSGVVTTHTAEAHIKVCIPNQDNWIYFFKSAHQAYLAKQKVIKEEKLKEEQKKNDDGFRRF